MEYTFVYKRGVHALVFFVMLGFSNQFVCAAELGSDVPSTTGNDIGTAVAAENKLLSDNSVSVEMRIGSILWSGLAWPDSSISTNGINGKNFLYPTIPIIGVGSRFGLTPNIRMTPSIDFIFDEYVYRADLDRSFRTQNMTGSAVGPVASVMGILISVPVWFDFPIEKNMVFSLSAGLALYPRLALVALDGSSGIEKITQSLNREAKWLYPETGIAFHYAVNPWLAVGLECQILYPIYQIWNSDKLPFYDTMMVISTFGFDFFF
jgi:hypothetical protein